MAQRTTALPGPAAVTVASLCGPATVATFSSLGRPAADVSGADRPSRPSGAAWTFAVCPRTPKRSEAGESSMRAGFSAQAESRDTARTAGRAGRMGRWYRGCARVRGAGVEVHVGGGREAWGARRGLARGGTASRTPPRRSPRRTSTSARSRARCGGARGTRSRRARKSVRRTSGRRERGEHRVARQHDEVDARGAAPRPGSGACP